MNLSNKQLNVLADEILKEFCTMTQDDILIEWLREILKKHPTNPTDEGIEKPTKCITADVKPTKEILLGKDEPSQDWDMGCEVYGLVSNNEVLITRIVYLKPVKEVEGIEKEEPTPIKNILSKLVKERDATNNWEYNYDQTEIGYANWLARAIQIIEQEPIWHKELVSVTCPKCWLLIKNPLYKDNMPKEVKPPTKDTIEKIWDFKDLYSFPNNPRVGQTCAGYIWNGEHRLEQGFDYMKFECLRTKYNELVDTVNHQQAHPHQLLSGK